jgi:hypothetical protein
VALLTSSSTSLDSAFGSFTSGSGFGGVQASDEMKPNNGNDVNNLIPH